jgi:hypothetical protein
MINSGENNKHCDLYPHGSIHQVRKCQKGHLWFTDKIDSIPDYFSKIKLEKMPEYTLLCPGCNNLFPANWVFIHNQHFNVPSCIRCFEKYNLYFSDRDKYREAVRAEILLELQNKK